MRSCDSLECRCIPRALGSVRVTPPAHPRMMARRLRRSKFKGSRRRQGGAEHRESTMIVGRRTSIEAPSEDEESVEDETVAHAQPASVEEPDTELEHAPVEEPERLRPDRERRKAHSKKSARK